MLSKGCGWWERFFMSRVYFCVWDCTQLVEDACTLQLGLLSNLACYERDVSLWYKRYFTVSDAGLLFPHGMSFISLSVFLRRPLCALLVLFWRDVLYSSLFVSLFRAGADLVERRKSTLPGFGWYCEITYPGSCTKFSPLKNLQLLLNQWSLFCSSLCFTWRSCFWHGSLSWMWSRWINGNGR